MANLFHLPRLAVLGASLSLTSAVHPAPAAIPIAPTSLTSITAQPSTLLQRGTVRRDPMTDKEVEEMREYRDDPPKRIHAMLKMIQARGLMLDQIRSDPKALPPEERGPRIHDLLEDITNLSDEFDDNVDTFLKEQADIRKPLAEAV